MLPPAKMQEVQAAMGEYTRKAVMAVPSIDYYKFYCLKCSGEITGLAVGDDGAVDHVQFTCSKCGELGRYKVQFLVTGKVRSAP